MTVKVEKCRRSHSIGEQEKLVRDRLQISLLILSELGNFYSPWNQKFSDVFRGNRSLLIRLILSSIKCEIWRQSLSSGIFMIPDSSRIGSLWIHFLGHYQESLLETQLFIETSHLIFSKNQFTGVYMMGRLS